MPKENKILKLAKLNLLLAVVMFACRVTPVAINVLNRSTIIDFPANQSKTTRYIFFNKSSSSGNFSLHKNIKKY